MTRSLSVLLTLIFAASAAAAEVRPRTGVPMDRVPCELAEARLVAPTEWFDAPHIPIDHPYWWTLTDEITPAELRGRLQRRVAAERQRLQAEIERRAAGASTNEPLDLDWELRGRETPELFPVWNAFDTLARGHSIRGDNTLQELVDFGISPEAAHQIVLAAEERWAGNNVMQQIADAQKQYRELRSRAEEKIGMEELVEMMRRNDFARFSELVGWSQGSLHDLVRLAHCNWWAAASVPVLVELREEIGQHQWDIFRRYLLERHASTTAQLYVLD